MIRGHEGSGRVARATVTQNRPTRDLRHMDLRVAGRGWARDGPFQPRLLGDGLWGEAYLSRAARVNVGAGIGQAARSTPCLLISYLSPALLLMPFGLNVVNEI